MSKKEKKENSEKVSKISPPEITPPSEENKQLRAKEEKITQLEKELHDLKKWKEDNLHKLADQLNRLKEIEGRKRIEIKEIEEYGKQSLLTKIINFLVNLESRVVKVMRNYPDPQGVVVSHAEAVEIALDNLKKDLEKEGVREITIQVGTDLWNSRWHECLEQVANEKLPAGTILEVVEKGYLLYERVLRTAKVKISKK